MIGAESVGRARPGLPGPLLAELGAHTGRAWAAAALSERKESQSRLSGSALH